MHCNIFYMQDLSIYLDNRTQQLRAKIYEETPQYLLNINDQEYLDHVESSYMVDTLIIHFDQVSVSSKEKLIAAERFPNSFDVQRGMSYLKQVITYHLPFSGNHELLRCMPSTGILWTLEVYIEDRCICFDIIDFYGDGERVKQEANKILSSIKTQVGHLTAEVGNYNKGLRDQAHDILSTRRKQLMNQNTVLTSLGVLIRKSENVPETFAVPTIRKKVVTKPTIHSTVGAVVPTVNEEIYHEILQTICDMGKVFERLPSTYAGKSEEMLRDHLILQLEPRFEGSTTGETFNKSGRTDILIRYENSNIFVAECKFWDGKAKHLKTIDQLLSYLTWRDSKTAIICFVKRKEITPVVDEIAESTKTHPCYVRRLDTKHNSWQIFEFHLPNDPGCKVKVAILIFHIPGP